MHREGVELNFDMLRYIYSLTKKKDELAFSFVAVPSLNIFVRLKDLPKTWRHMYFVVEHKSNFSDIRHLWVDKYHKIRHPQLPSNCSFRYVQRVYPRSRVANGESYSFKGIFLTFIFLSFLDG